jgi:hypothetical protein
VERPRPGVALGPAVRLTDISRGAAPHPGPPSEMGKRNRGASPRPGNQRHKFANSRRRPPEPCAGRERQQREQQRARTRPDGRQLPRTRQHWSAGTSDDLGRFRHRPRLSLNSRVSRGGMAMARIWRPKLIPSCWWHRPRSSRCVRPPGAVDQGRGCIRQGSTREPHRLVAPTRSGW